MSPDHSYDIETEHSASALAKPAGGTASLSELMHAGLGIPSPFMKDIFLVRQAIVGTRYQGGSDELVEDLKPGSRVTFVAEPDNKYDANAVMALDSQGRKLGYIPRHENSIIGALLKAGKSIYGIMPEKQPRGGKANRNTPYSIWVDLYMREFILPDDMTQIPRQGYQGSYVVIAMELAEDEDDNEYKDESCAFILASVPKRHGTDGHTPSACTMAEAIKAISAIKVINGAERDIFTEQAEENTMEAQRKLLRRFHTFAGYLPIVGHDIEFRLIPALAESYGVLLGIPFSNRVIDTKVMAKNHLPGKHRYTLDALADSLGIEVHADSGLEGSCRKTWKLYCRMERSELSDQE